MSIDLSVHCKLKFPLLQAFYIVHTHCFIAYCLLSVRCRQPYAILQVVETLIFTVPLLDTFYLLCVRCRQRYAILQAVEALIRTFLPAEPPQPPPFEAQTSGAAAAGSAAAAALSLSAGGNKNSDGRLIAAAATRASDISGGVRGPSSLQQRRLTAGKATAGGGSAMAGSTGDVKRSGAGAGDASSVRGGEVIRGADSGVFWDEAGAGGAGLVSSSPLDLEPILPPSSCSGLLSGRPSPSTAASPNAAARALATGTGGAMGSLFSGGLGTMASRFSGGAGATVTGAPGGNTDDQLWLVYEGTSAAGKGVVSRVNAPDPYWLGRASPGAVCPHPHSMEFYSAFEGANLLRAVQVRVKRGPFGGEGISDLRGAVGM